MATYKFLDPETLQTTTAANGGVRALVTGVGNGAVGASSIKFDNGSMASQAQLDMFKQGVIDYNMSQGGSQDEIPRAPMQGNLTSDQKQGLMNQAYSQPDSKQMGLLGQSMQNADQYSVQYGAGSTIARNIAGLPQPGEKDPYQQAAELAYGVASPSYSQSLSSVQYDPETGRNTFTSESKGAMGIAEVLSNKDFSADINVSPKPKQGKEESPESYMMKVGIWAATTAGEIHNATMKSVTETTLKAGLTQMKNDASRYITDANSGLTFQSQSDYATYLNSPEFGENFTQLDTASQKLVDEYKKTQEDNLASKLSRIQGSDETRKAYAKAFKAKMESDITEFEQEQKDRVSSTKKETKTKLKASFAKAQKQYTGMTAEQIQRVALTERTDELFAKYKASGTPVTRSRAKQIAQIEIAEEKSNPGIIEAREIVDEIMNTSQRDPVFGYVIAPADYAEVVAAGGEANAQTVFENRIGGNSAKRAYTEYLKAQGRDEQTIFNQNMSYDARKLLTDEKSGVMDLNDFVNSIEKALGDSADPFISAQLETISKTAKSAVVRGNAAMLLRSYEPEKKEMKFFEIGKQGKESIIGIDPITGESKTVFGGHTPSGSSKSYAGGGAGKGESSFDELPTSQYRALKNAFDGVSLGGTGDERAEKRKIYERYLDEGDITGAVDYLKTIGRANLKASDNKAAKSSIMNISKLGDALSVMKDNPDLNFSQFDEYGRNFKRVFGFQNKEREQVLQAIESAQASIRNELFGASLTEGEKASAERFIISPSDTTEIVKMKVVGLMAMEALNKEIIELEAAGLGIDSLRDRAGVLRRTLGDYVQEYEQKYGVNTDIMPQQESSGQATPETNTMESDLFNSRSTTLGVPQQYKQDPSYYKTQFQIYGSNLDQTDIDFYNQTLDQGNFELAEQMLNDLK